METPDHYICKNIDCDARPCFVYNLQLSISKNDTKSVRHLLEKSKLPESYDNLSIVQYVHDAMYKSRSIKGNEQLLYYSDLKGTEAANVFESYNNITIDYIRILLGNIDYLYPNKIYGVKWVISKFYLRRNNELDFTEFEKLLYDNVDICSVKKKKNNHVYGPIYKESRCLYDMYVKVRAIDVSGALVLYMPIVDINNIVLDYIY